MALDFGIFHEIAACRQTYGATRRPRKSPRPCFGCFPILRRLSPARPSRSTVAIPLSRDALGQRRKTISRTPIVDRRRSMALDNEKTVLDFLAAWPRANADELMSYFAPDAVYH